MDFQQMFQLYDYYMRMAERETETNSAYDPTWVNEVFTTERKSYYNAAIYLERQLEDF